MIDVQSFAEAIRKTRIIDLTHSMEEHMPHYPTHSRFYHHLWGSYWHGDRALTYQVVMNEHSGTHVDAPAHFMSDAKGDAHVTIDRVPLGSLMGRGARLDCRQFKEGECVPPEFVTAWETRNGALQAGDIVLFDFGWARHWALRPHNKPYLQNWPGVSIELAEYLIRKSVAAIGVDTLSPDNPEALATAPIHPLLLENQILIMENLTNLDGLPPYFLFLALPLKIKAGSGSPIRAVALV